VSSPVSESSSHGFIILAIISFFGRERRRCHPAWFEDVLLEILLQALSRDPLDKEARPIDGAAVLI